VAQTVQLDPQRVELLLVVRDHRRDLAFVIRYQCFDSLLSSCVRLLEQSQCAIALLDQPAGPELRRFEVMLVLDDLARTAKSAPQS